MHVIRKYYGVFLLSDPRTMGRQKSRRSWSVRATNAPGSREISMNFIRQRARVPDLRCPLLFLLPRQAPSSTMPRKTAATTDGSEPRRSSRIKDLPKPDPPKKAPAKPRAKKAEGEAPKRGKKRAAEETNGVEPTAKKVRPHRPSSALSTCRLLQRGLWG
jgi:hypothetical protein